MRLPEPITSRSNARVKALRAAFHGKAREPGELAGVEGMKSVLEAHRAGLQCHTLALTVAGSAHYTSDDIAALGPREVVLLTDDVMRSVVDTVTAPPVAATLEIPDEHRAGPASGIFLLLEEIQDPGNLGTLIRSAEAFGVERVYLSPGCANVWSPKVLRASAGSVFRQAIARGPLAAAVGELHRLGVRVLAAVARQKGAQVSLAATLASPVALAIGNEGVGLSEAMLSLVHGKVYIPCRTESLNAAVAGSVLLYAALEQSTRQQQGAPSAAVEEGP